MGTVCWKLDAGGRWSALHLTGGRGTLCGLRVPHVVFHYMVDKDPGLEPCRRCAARRKKLYGA